MARPRIFPILASLAFAALMTLGVFRFVEIRTDMADFIPTGQTEAARFMLREIRSGAAANLILIGIEGAPPTELARISARMGDALSQSDLFRIVQNGRQALAGGPDEQWLFDNRYLLSSVTTPTTFTEAALRDDFQDLLRQLQSSAAPIVQQYGFADPPGAFLALAKEWVGESRLTTIDGAWLSPSHDRALLIVKSRASGTDMTAQDAVVLAIRSAFVDAQPGAARLLLAGPAVFAQEAARTIRSDVERLSVVSVILVAALLLWRFRSVWVLAAVGVPVMVSISMAALAVQLIFGSIHGIAFGFGMTMLGVTVDYPVLLIGHRKRGEEAGATLRRIHQAFVLAVITCVLGLTGMIFSGFPGLAQLGVFSTIGIVTAAAVTRWILPSLIVAADLAPVPSGDPRDLLRVEAARRWRAWCILPMAAAAASLAVNPPRWEDDLQNLSPVPEAARALDASLRRQIGAPDVGQLFVVTGETAEIVLHRQEALMPILADLQREGATRGAEFAARYLPSAETQLSRLASLPDPGLLEERISAARNGLPFRETAFRPFIEDVTASRGRSPLRLADVTSPLIAARLEPLLFERDGIWHGPIAPLDVQNPRRLTEALAGSPGMFFVDTRAEANAIVTTYTRQAWLWLGLGGITAIMALAIGLRDPARVFQVVSAIAAAGLVTVAILSAFGVRFSLLHIVSLQLVVGVGFDYALFFARRQLDEEERARTLRTLVTCNAMTLLTFGLLGLCQTPLLRDIGTTVAVGALMSLLCSFLIVGINPVQQSETA